MSPRILLDTHVLVRWMSEPRRLSRDQLRLLREAARRREQIAISAITLLELALLVTAGGVARLKISLESLFAVLEESPTLRVLPLTMEIAREVAALVGALRDPADCVIVATARVYGLRLLTSDERIVESNFVSTVD
jgi:PIN domain nuclease of toxin-antitoxin system